MNGTIGGKKGNIFNEGVLSQFRVTEDGFKIVTPLDKLPEPYRSDAHIEALFDLNGNYLRTTFTMKKEAAPGTGLEIPKDIRQS